MSASTREFAPTLEFGLGGATTPQGARHPVDQYLLHLGPGSRRTMAEAIEKLARMVSEDRSSARDLAWHALRFEETSALRDRLAATLAPATANKHLAALRGVLKQAFRAGLMNADDYRRAIDIPSVQGVAPRPSRHLPPEERSALLAACCADPSPAGRRDAAIFALLAGAGLRRSEVVGIALEDYARDAGSLHLAAVTGRSGASKRFPLSPEIQDAIDAWIRCRGEAAGPLFNPINKGGRIEIRRLSEQAIYVACRKRSAEAGVTSVSPEDLRCPRIRTEGRRMRRAEPASATTAGIA